MSELAELLLRVEAATGPDLTLGNQILRALGYLRQGSLDERHITNSIDAALALAERVSSDMNVHGYDIISPDGRAEAFIGRNHVKEGHWLALGEAQTAPLAFCAAILKAKIAR